MQLSSSRVLLAFCLLLALALPGCAARPAQPEGLRVWIQWGDNPKQIQALFDQYTAKTGIKIEVTSPIPQDKILPAISGSNPPDIVVLSNISMVKAYYHEGLLEELSGAVQNGGINLDDFFPAPLALCRQGQDILCLPWGTDLFALFWNKDLFAAAGLDPNTPPQTLEQLVDYANKLTIISPDGRIQQIGFIPDRTSSHMDFYQSVFDGSWYDPSGTHLTVNSQANLDMFTWQQQFYTRYGIDKMLAFASGFGEYMSPDQPFYAGKLAMILDGEWQTGQNFISHFKPELNYGVAPFPPPADHPERSGAGFLDGTVVVIPSGARDKAAAARLLGWMMSPEVVAQEFCFNANLPTSKLAAQDPCFTTNPKFMVFINLMQSPNTRPLASSPITLEMQSALRRAEEKILHTGAGPKPLLDDVQNDFEPMLENALK